MFIFPYTCKDTSLDQKKKVLVKILHSDLLLCQVEQLEQEVAELRQALSDKQEQESVMLQVLFPVLLYLGFLFFSYWFWACYGNCITYYIYRS